MEDMRRETKAFEIHHCDIEIPLSIPFAIVIFSEPDHEPPLVGAGAIRGHWMHKHRRNRQLSRFGHENEFEDLPGANLILVEVDVELEKTTWGTATFVICYQ